METTGFRLSPNRPLTLSGVTGNADALDLNKANLEFVEFAANKTKIDSDKINEETERLVVNKLNRSNSNDSGAITPQLAEPTALINAETMQNLLTDLQNLGDEPELAVVLMSFVQKAVSDYKSKGVDPDLPSALKLFVTYASTVMPETTPEIQQLFSELMAVENEQDLVNVLRGYVAFVISPKTQQLFSDLIAAENEQDFANVLKAYYDFVLEDTPGIDLPPQIGNPPIDEDLPGIGLPPQIGHPPVDEDRPGIGLPPQIGPPPDLGDPIPAKKSMIAMFLALLHLIIDTQNLREETEAELSGMLIILSYEQSEIDAEKTRKIGLYSLMGAGAGFGFTFGVTAVAAGMQLTGFRQGREMVDLKSQGKQFEKDIAKLRTDLLAERTKFTQPATTTGQPLTVKQRAIQEKEDLEGFISAADNNLGRIKRERLGTQTERESIDRAKIVKQREVLNLEQLERDLPPKIDRLKQELTTLEQTKTRLKQELKALPDAKESDLKLVARDKEIQLEMQRIGQTNPALKREIEQKYYGSQMYSRSVAQEGSSSVQIKVEKAQARINKVETDKLRVNNSLEDVKLEIQSKTSHKQRLEQQFQDAGIRKTQLNEELRQGQLRDDELAIKDELLDGDLADANRRKEGLVATRTTLEQLEGDVFTSVSAEKKMSKKLDKLDKEVEATQKKIDELDGNPDFYRNIGFALAGMNNGSQVFMDGFGFMGKEKEAEKTIVQARKDNLAQMAQQRDQERTSGVGGLRSSMMNSVEESRRSHIEALGAVAQGIAR